MIPIDDSSATAFVFTTLAVSLVLYVWTAMALSAVFRKAGEEAWKAWVPVLNAMMLLKLGGLPALSFLLVLIPIVGLPIVWVLTVTACYRISVSFGHGAGMTVLAAIAPPVWATILGAGPSRWLGADAPIPAGPRRTAAADDFDPFARRELSPFAPLFGTADTPQQARDADTTGALTPPVAQPDVAAEVDAVLEPVAAPEPDMGEPMAPEAVVGEPVAAEPPMREPVTPEPVVREPVTPEPVVREPVAAEPAPAVQAAASAAPVPAPVPRQAEPSPAEPVPATAILHTAERAPDPFDEVTGAAPDAPHPISAVSTTFDRPPVTTMPPVTRLPAAAVGARPAEAEPWAPQPDLHPDGFPEFSGEVSAIVGAPDAGGPRSARGSVSAQYAREAPPEFAGDALDETIITRRRRAAWSLIPPSGAPVALRADVVLVGRKPLADPAYPGAQLVAVDDGTVSKTHAMLRLQGERWFVTDLNSTNGVLFATFMGTEVEATPGVEIEAGERFFLGDAEVKLQRSDG